MLSLLNLIKSYGKAMFHLENLPRIITDVNLLDSGYQLIVGIDAYDLIDFLFPKTRSIDDEHYEEIKKVWEKFFATEVLNKEIKIVIPPASVCELLLFLRKNALIARDGFKITEEIKGRNGIELLVDTWNKYIDTQKIIKEINEKAISSKLRSLFNEEKIISFREASKYIKDKLSCGHIETLYSQKKDIVNWNRGKNYFNKKRWGWNRILPNQIDLNNGLLFIALKIESTNRNIKRQHILTSHGEITLNGWDRLYCGNLSQSPFRHSLCPTFIKRLYAKFPDFKEIRQFLETCNTLDRQIIKLMDDNKLIPPLLLFQQKEVEINKEVRIPYYLDSLIKSWMGSFVYVLCPPKKEAIKESEHSSIKLDELSEWARNKKKQKEDFEKILEFSKEIVDTFTLLEPELDGLLVPRHLGISKIYKWLKRGEFKK